MTAENPISHESQHQIELEKVYSFAQNSNVPAEFAQEGSYSYGLLNDFHSAYRVDFFRRRLPKEERDRRITKSWKAIFGYEESLPHMYFGLSYIFAVSLLKENASFQLEVFSTRDRAVDLLTRLIMDQPFVGSSFMRKRGLNNILSQEKKMLEKIDNRALRTWKHLKGLEDRSDLDKDNIEQIKAQIEEFFSDPASVQRFKEPIVQSSDNLRQI